MIGLFAIDIFVTKLALYTMKPVYGLGQTMQGASLCSQQLNNGSD